MSEQVFTYKGYVGSIQVSVEDACLFGQILFVNDLVNYEGDTLLFLKANFEAAVDFYLERCEEENISPDKPFSGSFNVRIPSALHKEACVYGAQRGTSLNEVVKESLHTFLFKEKTVVNQTHHHTHIHEVSFSSVEASFEQTNPEESWQQRQNPEKRRAHH